MEVLRMPLLVKPEQGKSLLAQDVNVLSEETSEAIVEEDHSLIV